MNLANEPQHEKLYVTERVTNIAELEKIIMDCYMLAQRLQKESPHDKNFQTLVEGLKEANEFEFCVERRKTIYCE